MEHMKNAIILMMIASTWWLQNLFQSIWRFFYSRNSLLQKLSFCFHRITPHPVYEIQDYRKILDRKRRKGGNTVPRSGQNTKKNAQARHHIFLKGYTLGYLKMVKWQFFIHIQRNKFTKPPFLEAFWLGSQIFQ